jgi:hypothetical protein
MENKNPVDLVNYTPPGISWTAPEKSRPWQQPPQVTNVSDVCIYYIGVVSNPETMDDMIDAIETSIPLAVIAEAMMLNSVSNGIHTLDTGILAMPVIIEMLQNLAIVHGTEYVIFPDDYDKKVTVSNRVARLAVQKAMKKIEGAEEEEPEIEEQPKGFMRKRKEVM